VSISLFLDSNIWLSFYEFTDDTLDELTKLQDRITTGGIELLILSRSSMR
jgi:hypothetical protein